MTDADERPVAVVLGAAVWPGGVASPTLRRRAEEAARLWLEGQVRLVVGCGGVGRHGPSEAEVIQAICVGLGVPAAAVLVESRSTTTEQNLMYARPLLTAAGGGRIVIVTDRYHLPRARLVARRLGLDAGGAWPHVPGPLTARRVWLWLREGGAYLGYAVQGRGRD